ncbi:hypothetical protein [Phycisphaera mikurensis]|uniref:Uncharacterized protein n=1 Tax=Phycisphaera mikurensis (strain NBRC 102666 / KCTC 22515 / FYK2301M01) TaxID=1142394 RepID=I0IBU1_PHYMF|nr:hypothetical protein [Phycisphaera mikurensis]MBB6442043.1 hypothetical protein [Phycisphaera mikurensis]BAM02729.1 hypothetical protein PSMK_05700 [Phycisphaera mikurensis NBRC 102666]
MVPVLPPTHLTAPSARRRARFRRGRPAAGAAAALAGLLLAAAAGSPPAAAQGAAADSSYPRPSLAGDAWQLAMTARNPEVISVRGLSGEPRWYWFLPYAVLNDTGEDRLFVPEVTVVTDGGELIEAGRGVPASVFAAIAERVGNPYLENPEAVIGPIRQGEDFVKESVAIWPVPAADVDRMTIFFAGLSGETREAVSPVTGEVVTELVIDPATGRPALGPDGQPRTQPVLLRRTEVLEYLTPGTPRSPDRLPTILLDRSTVLR